MFYYKNGDLFYKKDFKYGRKKDEPASVPHSAGYKAINISRRTRMAHQLIWMYHHGYMPKMIDHIDGNKLNNDINNLRAVTSSQNQFNRKINKNNSTGYKGISIMKVKSKKKTYKYFLASISYNNTPIKKTFSVLEDAVKFINETRVCVHGEHARYA